MNELKLNNQFTFVIDKIGKTILEFRDSEDIENKVN
jgi:hypothetical protein